MLAFYLLLSSVVDFSSYKQPFLSDSQSLTFSILLCGFIYIANALFRWNGSHRWSELPSNDHQALIQMTFLIPGMSLLTEILPDYSGKKWHGILSTLPNSPAKNSFSAEEFQVYNYRKKFFISLTFYINTRTSTLNSFLKPASKHPGKHIKSSSFQSLTLIYSSTNT